MSDSESSDLEFPEISQQPVSQDEPIITWEPIVNHKYKDDEGKEIFFFDKIENGKKTGFGRCNIEKCLKERFFNRLFDFRFFLYYLYS